MDDYFKSLVRNIKNSNILITGASGLIGSTLIKMISEISDKERLDISIYAMVRDKHIAGKILDDYHVNYIVGDVNNLTIEDFPSLDYIIHGASITDSKMFIEKPIETIKTAILGSINMLELAKSKSIKSMIYLSSMEIYGEVVDGKLLKESDLGTIDILSVRSSYSESKRMIENMCVSYCEEQAVPVKIIRLAQTFGPGVKYTDRRVFAEFARCVIEKKDIILHTEGKSERMYLYTEDAVGAIMTVLINGENGHAYNAANEETYCSIVEMAKLVAKEIANNEISVRIEVNKMQSKQYYPEHHLKLDTSKIGLLGWKARYGLKSMFQSLINDMYENKD